MRIPTLLALILLFTLLFLGLMLHINNKTQEEKSLVDFSPLNIRFANQSPSSITIIWQSLKPTIGEIAWGETQSLGNLASDDRDIDSKTARLTHFVTIKNLKEDRSIFLKIRNGPFFYPTLPLETKTSLKVVPTNLQPITGKILDLTGQPTDEALIFLELPNTAPIATYTSSAGNFLLPLNELKTQDLKSNFVLDENAIIGNLLVTKGSLQSRIKLNLSKVGSDLLPIVLGQDQDLTTSQNFPAD